MKIEDEKARVSWQVNADKKITDKESADQIQAKWAIQSLQEDADKFREVPLVNYDNE